MMLMTDDRQEILTTLARTPDAPLAIHRVDSTHWSLGKDSGPGLPGAAFRALERDGLIRFTDRVSVASSRAVIVITPAGLAALID